MAHQPLPTLSSILSQEYGLAPVQELRPHPQNVRKGDVDAIAESIDANGFYGSVYVQKSTGYIIAGTHRFLAAQKQGLVEIPVIWIDCDDEVAVRIMLVDNATSDKGEVYENKLLELLQGLPTLVGTGYGLDDLQLLIQPEYTPILTPESGTRDLTAADMGVNVNPSTAQKQIVDVKCPHCGQEFGIESRHVQ